MFSWIKIGFIIGLDLYLTLVLHCAGAGPELWFKEYWGQESKCPPPPSLTALFICLLMSHIFKKYSFCFFFTPNCSCGFVYHTHTHTHTFSDLQKCIICDCQLCGVNCSQWTNTTNTYIIYFYVYFWYWHTFDIRYFKTFTFYRRPHEDDVISICPTCHHRFTASLTWTVSSSAKSDFFFYPASIV